MEYRQHDLRYETCQVLSDEREGGCSCRPMFNKKKVVIERGYACRQIVNRKGVLMENGSSSLIVFDLEDLIDIIEREVYKLRGRKNFSWR